MRYADRKIDTEAALRDLEHADPRVRIQAADALGQVSAAYVERAQVALRPLLRDERADIRYTVALSLGELKDQSSLPALIEQMEGDGNPLARQAAVIALGLIGDSQATTPLIKALRHGTPEVRFQATISLAQINPQVAPEHLRKALRDEDAEVRTSAITALADLGDPQASQTIFRLLNDPVPTVRLEAAMALARLGDRRGTEVLVENLSDKEQHIQAAEHLFRCPDPTAIPALHRILQRWLSPALLKVWAAGTLSKMGDEEGRRKLLALLTSRKEMIKGLCIQLLGTIEEPWAQQALIELGNSPRGSDWQEEIHEALKNRG